MAISSNGKYIYTTNAGDNTISEFVLDQESGSIRQLTGSPIQSGGRNPSGIAIDSHGRFAYVANFNSNEIIGYSIAADGTLHELTNAMTLTTPRPKSLVVAPNGSTLYVTNVDTNVVTAYHIATDGTLRPLLQ